MLAFHPYPEPNMTRHRFAGLLIVLSMAACASAAPRVRQFGEGEARLVQATPTMARVAVAEPSYVAVVGLSAGGPSLLYPRAGESPARLSAGPHSLRFGDVPRDPRGGARGRAWLTRECIGDSDPEKPRGNAPCRFRPVAAPGAPARPRLLVFVSGAPLARDSVEAAVDAARAADSPEGFAELVSARLAGAGAPRWTALLSD